LAQVLAKSQHPEAHHALIKLADNANKRVRRVAAQSMGATQDPDFVPTLLRLLADDDVHVAVWDALASYGSAILDTPVEAFENEATDERVRRRIPRVVSAIPEQRAADVLLLRLQCTDSVLRYNVSTALLRLRFQRSGIPARAPTLFSLLAVAQDVVTVGLQRQRIRLDVRTRQSICPPAVLIGGG
jgi:HEAT repeat protein